MFELIDERRQRRRRGRRHPGDAARGPPRGRVADVRPGAARRADDPAGGGTRDHRVDVGVGLRAACRASREVLATLVDEIDADGDDAYLTATIQETLRRQAGAAERRAPARDGADRGRWLDVSGGCVPGAPAPTCCTTTPTSTRTRTRFAPSGSSSEAPGTYTWIPFGGGRRRCLGIELRDARGQAGPASRARVLRGARRGAPGGEVARRRNITVGRPAARPPCSVRAGPWRWPRRDALPPR